MKNTTTPLPVRIQSWLASATVSSPWPPLVRWAPLAGASLIMIAMAAPAGADENQLAAVDLQSSAAMPVAQQMPASPYTDAAQRPEVVAGRFRLPPLTARSTAIDPVGNGRGGDAFSGPEDQVAIPLPESGIERGVPWDWSVVQWAAPNTFSHPRYFEDRMLERHGHQRWGFAQPVASGVRFFTTVPMLPYLSAIKHPCEFEYTMGYFRAGSPAPLVFQRPPWDRRAILAESAAVATGMIVIP